MKGGIRSIYTPKYDVSLYDLLKTYASLQMQKSFQTINIPKLPVFTTEDGISRIKDFFGKLLILHLPKTKSELDIFGEIYIILNNNLIVNN